MPFLKLTDEIAHDIRTRVKSLDFGAIEKIKKAGSQNGTFDVIISTEVKDRSGEIVRQDGWDLSNYKNNPIVLWGHDYYSLPIGVCTETYNTTYRGVPALGARGVFLSADINPLAQQVRRMYEYGVKSGYNVGCTTSVGFIPKEFAEDDRTVITRAELLEFSFVPIPANQGVGPAQGRALTMDEARELGIDTVGLRHKGLSFAEIRGSIPTTEGTAKAAENTVWKKPTLKDFTDKQWADLTDQEKATIASHFAYVTNGVASSFDDLKLPYRNADGAVVLNGLKAAVRDLVATIDLPSDRKAVYEHLAAQYKLFGKEAPAYATLKEAQAGDDCTMDDGTPGVLATDPNDPDGALVCMPVQEKAADTAHASQKALIKALADEHARHTDEMDKALDDFREKAAVVEDQGDPEDANKSKKAKPADLMRECFKDLRSALADEHVMHRAKTIACFRSFDPSENKAFDKNPHLKALRDQHSDYETKCNKGIDEYEERCMKSVQGEPGSTDEHTDWVTGLMDTAARTHKKAVTKIAKAMCKDAFGEEDQADEKTIEILTEFLAPHIDKQLLPAVVAKIGARLAAQRKSLIAGAYEHLKAASAVVAELHGGLENDDGEEGRSDDEGTPASTTVPKNQRSRPSKAATANDGLNDHLFAREVLRGITTAAQRGLEQLNKQARG